MGSIFFETKQFQNGVKAFLRAMILNENEEYKKFIEQILKNIGFDINNPDNFSGLGYHYFEIGKI